MLKLHSASCLYGIQAAPDAAFQQGTSFRAKLPCITTLGRVNDSPVNQAVYGKVIVLLHAYSRLTQEWFILLGHSVQVSEPLHHFHDYFVQTQSSHVQQCGFC